MFLIKLSKLAYNYFVVVWNEDVLHIKSFNGNIFLIFLKQDLFQIEFSSLFPGNCQQILYQNILYTKHYPIF